MCSMNQKFIKTVFEDMIIFSKPRPGQHDLFMVKTCSGLILILGVTKVTLKSFVAKIKA